MGRTLPTYCDHGWVVDWGDFGPEDEEEKAECRDCRLQQLLDRIEELEKRANDLNDHAIELEEALLQTCAPPKKYVLFTDDRWAQTYKIGKWEGFRYVHIAAVDKTEAENVLNRLNGED